MKRLLLILVAAGMSACGSVDNDRNDKPEDLGGNVSGPETYGVVDVPHFIIEYALSDEAYPDVISRTVEWRGDDFVFCVYGCACRWVNVKAAGDDALLYESLCERFGDMTYDKVRNFTAENLDYVPAAGIMDAVSVCKKSGLNLVDIADKCHFCTMTLRPYIESDMSIRMIGRSVRMGSISITMPNTSMRIMRSIIRCRNRCRNVRPKTVS